MTDRDVTIGAGPFQPPTMGELRDITHELTLLKFEHERVRTELRETRDLLAVSHANDLSILLNRVLPDNGGVGVDTDMDGDLSITIEGLTLVGNGLIILPERDFECSATITFEHRATIRATDADAAAELYSEAVRDQLYDVDLEIRGDFVEDQDYYDAESDNINVREF